MNKDIYNLNQIIEIPFTKDNVKNYKYHFGLKDIDNMIYYLSNNDYNVSIQEYDLSENKISFRELLNKNRVITSYKNINNQMYYTGSIKIDYYDNISIQKDNINNIIIFIGETHDSCQDRNNLNNFINSNLNILSNIKLANDLYIEQDITFLESDICKFIFDDIEHTGVSLKSFTFCNNSQDSLVYDPCYEFTWYNLTDLRNTEPEFYQNLDKYIINYFAKDLNTADSSYDDNDEEFLQKYTYNTINFYFNFFIDDITNVNDISDIIDKAKPSVPFLTNVNNNNLTLIDIFKYLELNTSTISRDSFYNQISAFLSEQILIKINENNKYYNLYNFINNYYGVLLYILLFENRILKSSYLWKVVDSVRNYFLNPQNKQELELYIYYYFLTNIYFDDYLFEYLTYLYDICIEYHYSQDKKDFIQLIAKDFYNYNTTLFTHMQAFLFDINTLSRLNYNPNYKVQVSPIYNSMKNKYSILYSGAVHTKAIHNYYILLNQYFNVNNSLPALEFILSKSTQVAQSDYQVNIVNQSYLSFRDIFLLNIDKKLLIKKLLLIKDHISISKKLSSPTRTIDDVADLFNQKRMNQNRDDFNSYKQQSILNIGYYAIYLFNELKNYTDIKIINKLLNSINIEYNTINGYLSQFINICSKKYDYNLYNLLDDNPVINCITKQLIFNITNLLTYTKIDKTIFTNYQKKSQLQGILAYAKYLSDERFDVPQKTYVTNNEMKIMKTNLLMMYKLIILSILFIIYPEFKIISQDTLINNKDYVLSLIQESDYFFIKSAILRIIHYEVEDTINNPLQYDFNMNISQDDLQKLDYYNLIIKYGNSF